MKDDDKSKPAAPSESPKPIRKILGPRHPVLPGESAKEYSDSLFMVLTDLQASTPLQLHIAQCHMDCMQWTLRYERHKVTTLTVEMAKCITDPWDGPGLSEEQGQVVQLLVANKWDDEALQERMQLYDHTPQTLLQEAMRRAADVLAESDRLIAQRVQTMLKLQAGFDWLVTRRAHIERLKLQNKLLRKNLSAVDVQAIEKPDPTNRSDGSNN